MAVARATFQQHPNLRPAVAGRECVQCRRWSPSADRRLAANEGNDVSVPGGAKENRGTRHFGKNGLRDGVAAASLTFGRSGGRGVWQGGRNVSGRLDSGLLAGEPLAGTSMWTRMEEGEEGGGRRRRKTGRIAVGSKVTVVHGGERAAMVARKVAMAESASLVEEEEEGSGERKDPLLLRVARGEDAERTPVWLMRQAGRYMADFRKFSDQFPFRMRSETSEIAIELSLQPWRAFKPDGVIMFSDILTPLPALGINFDVVKGKGPRIDNPIRTFESLQALRPLEDPEKSLPFVRETLCALRREVGGDAAVLGFIGSPWTLAAYSTEGAADRHLLKTKKLMMREPALLHELLKHLTEALIKYVIYQIQSGAQIVQVFDSWAHHLSPSQFEEFSFFYAEKVMEGVHKVYPDVPLIFHANGGAGKLPIICQSKADVVGLDWATSMREARKVFGPKNVLQGNVDPMTLFGTEEVIRAAVADCMRDAGKGGRHILNVGHGVVQGTPEDSVKLFCELARESGENVTMSSSKEDKLEEKELLNI